MKIEALQMRGFRPVKTKLHGEDLRGIIGSVVLKKRRGPGNTMYYVSAIYKFRDSLRYGEPVPVPRDMIPAEVRA